MTIDLDDSKPWPVPVWDGAQSTAAGAVEQVAMSCGYSASIGLPEHACCRGCDFDAAEIKSRIDAAVAAERELWRCWVEEAVSYVGCEMWSPSLKEEGERLLGLKA